MAKAPKEEFIELMIENCKVNGLDNLTSKLTGILFIEPKEISLEELSKKSGYSLSGVSITLKFLERIGFVKKIKKPKSRKVYFYMDKDISKIGLEIMKKKYEGIILRSKKILPEIIKEYKKQKNYDKEELKIIERYYHQIIKGERVLKKLIFLMEKLKGGKK